MKKAKIEKVNPDEWFICTNCKKRVHIIKTFTKDCRLCETCLDIVHKKVISKINPIKLKNISYLESKMLFDIYFNCLLWEAKVVFQFEIIDHGCNIENEDYQEDICEKNDFYCPECQYSYEYTKYILDFAIFKGNIRLDLELDGIAFHDKNYDQQRDQYMKEKGWKVLRFDSNVVKNNSKYILDEIERCIDGRGNKL